LNDQQFQQILEFFNLSWRGYRKVRKGVKKRLYRHMHLLGCRTVKDYIETLKKYEEIRRECLRRMTVSISRFFRDYAVWQALEKEVLPDIITHQPQSLKVWSAGCACGEEVYSFNILWHRLRARRPNLPDLSILATDVNPDCLVKAQEGVYNQSSMKHVSAQDRITCFESLPKGKRYRIKQQMTQHITWQVHQLLDRPPPKNFYIVFLRNNLLTYHLDPEKSDAFNRIVDTLDQNGYLVIGAHEKLPDNAATDFIRLTSSPHILRKVP
jgi:chemotaxis methyl-accepting protein methylase